jgi:hypothetical protein
MTTLERLREVLAYDAYTGFFTWRNTTRATRSGQRAGCLERAGYIVITIDYRCYKAHRLAWLYVYGRWPNGLIDHINGVKDDNRIANLRDVSTRGNTYNRRVARNNKAGLLGVTITKGKYFTASIQADGHLHYLGSFPSAEAAHAAYLEAKKKLHIVR